MTPRHFQRRKNADRGSILVVCVVLAALGAIGVAAFVSLLDARGHQVEASFEAMKRRATAQSGKALVRDALYTNHLHSNGGLASNTTYTVDGTASFPGVSYTYEPVASATIQAFGQTPLSDASAQRISKNGVVPITSYTVDVTASVSDNIANEAYNLQLRSYNPVLGGDLLVMHPSSDFSTTDTLVSGNLVVNGRAMFWDAAAKDMQGGIRADEYLLPNDIAGSTTLRNPANNQVLPLNMPIPVQTTGIAGSSPAYRGELDIVDSGSNDHNDYVTRWSATATGLSVLDGSVPGAVGPGPDTSPDGADDSTLEAEIASKTPDELMASLPANFPLSSRVLRAVADKAGPAFTADQLYSIYSNHYPIPDDAIAYLTGTHAAKIAPRGDELHQFNRTGAWSDGFRKVEVYLDSPNLPHLLVEGVIRLELQGQDDAIAASSAASLPPRGIAVNNPSSSLDVVEFLDQNRRRIVLSIAHYSTTATSVGMNFTGTTAFPRWDMILELQETGARFDASAVNTALIYGGIRGSRRIDVTTGTVSLHRQTNPTGYEEMLSRNAWVESYLAP